MLLLLLQSRQEAPPTPNRAVAVHCAAGSCVEAPVHVLPGAGDGGTQSLLVIGAVPPVVSVCFKHAFSVPAGQGHA